MRGSTVDQFGCPMASHNQGGMLVDQSIPHIPSVNVTGVRFVDQPTTHTPAEWPDLVVLDQKSRCCLKNGALVPDDPFWNVGESTRLNAQAVRGIIHQTAANLPI